MVAAVAMVSDGGQRIEALPGQLADVQRIYGSVYPGMSLERTYCNPTFEAC